MKGERNGNCIFLKWLLLDLSMNPVIPSFLGVDILKYAYIPILYNSMHTCITPIFRLLVCKEIGLLNFLILNKKRR